MIPKVPRCFSLISTMWKTSGASRDLSTSEPPELFFTSHFHL